jgi:signal transduction histidine kinase
MDHLESSIDHVFLEQQEQGHLVHDMKSPFNGIVGLTEPLSRMTKEADRKKLLMIVNVCGGRWCKHIESNVESGPLAMGMIEIKADKVNIGMLVDEACVIMNVAKDPREKAIKKPTVKINNTVPYEDLQVIGSDVHTSKCIYHIIMNAIKFTDDGSIDISHRLEGETYIVIIFADTGVGITADTLPNVFDPFTKFSERYPGESLGFGLCSTKEYIEFVGGKILIESEIGKGTRVELWIPKQASNIGQHNKGPFGFGYVPGTTPMSGPWLLQKRALGSLASDLLPAHFGIVGMAELLIETEAKPMNKKQLGMLQRSGNRVVEVLSLIRDATLRCESNVRPQMIPVALGSITDTIFTELNKALDKRGVPMKKKTVEFVNQIDSSLLSSIKTDPFYLYRICYQLCDNALKFTAEGKVTVSAQGSGPITIVIKDSGCGFDIGKLEEIFKPFHRLEPETFYGIGLGLNMVNDMAAKIGATFEFKSEKGNGTSVTLIAGEPTSEPPVVFPWTSDTVNVTASATVNPTEEVSTSSMVDPKTPVADQQRTVQSHPEISKLPEDKKPELPHLIEPVQIPQDGIPNPERVVNSAKDEVKPNEDIPAPVVKFDEPAKTVDNKNPDVPSDEVTYAEVPRDEEDISNIKRKTLAGDKYRILVEMDDGSEPPSVQSALSHLGLAVEVLKERIAVADATSATIKGFIKQIEAKYF